jgi:hypothetical protein
MKRGVLVGALLLLFTVVAAANEAPGIDPAAARAEAAASRAEAAAARSEAAAARTEAAIERLERLLEAVARDQNRRR